MESAFFAVNKPAGISSSQVVNKVKHLFKLNGVNIKMGNMGTLDLEASGVLVIALNKATRLFDYYSKLPKTYRTIIKFGIETDTLDHTGQIIKQSRIIPTIEQLQQSIKNLKGECLQMPPKFSAKKVNGERAYNLMRNGNSEELELKPKLVKIYDIKIVKQIDNCSWEFEITCGTGTYIRSVARDIATYNTTYGITTSIIRTKSGIFNLNNALDFETLTIDKILNNCIMPEKCLNIDTIEVDYTEYKHLINGIAVNKKVSDGDFLIKYNGKVVMLANCKNEQLKISVNLLNNGEDI